MIKQIIKRNRFLNKKAHTLLDMYLRLKSSYICKNEGQGKLLKNIIGGNSVLIGKGTRMDKTEIRIRGNNNQISIGTNCQLNGLCSFWLIGDNITIEIGNGCSFEGNVLFRAVENDVNIKVGDDCMFSNSIDLLTSDFHTIIDEMSGKRINHAKSIYIGKHVWVGQGAKLLKGADIGDNAIIGLNSVLSRQVEPSTLVAGIPAKVIKRNVNWKREL